MDNFTSNTYHMTEAPQGMSGGWKTFAQMRIRHMQEWDGNSSGQRARQPHLCGYLAAAARGNTPLPAAL